jgi:hypothetical protein
MRRSFLGLATILVCACGGADSMIGDGGGDENPNPMMEGGGGDTGVDGGNGDACMAIAEICGDMVDNDCDGVVDNGCKMLGTYVSGATGIDTNPGTKAMPVKTIAQGIKNAQAIGGKLTVYVGNSHYPEKVTLVEGISLEGGYHCDMMTCDWMRNPGTYDTAILNTDFEGVLAPASITRATKIDGFRLQGMPGQAPNTGSCAISVVGNPSITGNRINGADVTSGSTKGVEILAPNADPNGPLIENNDILGGSVGSLTTVGISFDAVPNSQPGSTVSATIRNNRIKGGTGEFTSGLNAWTSGTNTAIVGNAITSGNSPGGNNGTSSWGIQIFGIALIDSNVINGDQNAVGSCAGIQWCGGINSFSSTTTITNNVIYGNKAANSVAVYLQEAEKPAGLVILNSNFLDGAGGGPGGNPTKSAGVALHISGGNNATSIGRIRNNIIQGGQNLNRFGIWEDQVQGKTNKPAAMDTNQFFFPALQGRVDIFWRHWSGAAISDDVVVPANNFSGDPLVDNTWHLNMGSPCIDKGTMMDAPAKDRDGDGRPKGQGFDIGADEK